MEPSKDANLELVAAMLEAKASVNDENRKRDKMLFTSEFSRFLSANVF